MKRVVTILVLLVALLSMTTSAFGQGADATEVSEAQLSRLVVTRVIKPSEQQKAIEFWTRERIAAAQPMQLPVDQGPATVDVAALDEKALGPAGFAPAGAAAPDSEKIAQAAYGQDWKTLGPESASDDSAGLAAAGTSQIYTSYMVNGVAAVQNLYPHRWIGRLTFRDTAGVTNYCSATSISGNNILTAAHCVYDSTNNRWFSNWVFTPAYRNGSAPFGTFAATQCWVLSAWVNLSGTFAINSWSRHDVAVCRVRANSAGQTLNAAVGYMGRQWNYPYARHYHSLGYPFRNYNDALLTNAGLYLRTCVAESFQQTTETRGMGCNLGRGISGGPMMVGYALGSAVGVADGVNSGLFLGTQNLYGPRFNSNNIVPLCSTAAC